MNNPDIKISIVMSAYNAGKYLREAIDSILNQTFGNFEFIIINDGSTDATEEIILSYNDDRIVYIDNIQNKGLIYSLNLGLEKSRGKYIARMDADDIALPERLQVQYDYMEAHPGIGICGSNIESFFEDSSEKLVVRFPETDKIIRAYMFFQSTFCHPTVMMRKSVIEENHIRYPEQFVGTEDYALWIDIINYTQAHNIQQVLLKYRKHPESVTSLTDKANKKNRNASLIQELYLKQSGIVLPSEDMYTYSCFVNRSIDLPLGKEDQQKYTAILENFFLQLNNKQPDLYIIAKDYISKVCFYRFFKRKKLPQMSFLRKLYFEGIHSFSKKALSLLFKTKTET